MFNSLSGRLFLLTILLVVLADVFVLVPSISRFREDYMRDRLERAQIASLVLLADDAITSDLEEELLETAEVFNVVMRRDEVRQLVLYSPLSPSVDRTIDLREAGEIVLIRDAMLRLLNSRDEVIRIIGSPVREAGLLIEVTIDSKPMRTAMIEHGIRILIISTIIAVFISALLFAVVRHFLLKPIKGVVGSMQRYAASPEDTSLVIQPSAGVSELREAEQALNSLQLDLTAALRHKGRLAQLGGAVAKVSHDLRNILTSAQLFVDRIEVSKDPLVIRIAPKIVNSIRRAVSLCESTLAFGRAEEPSPTLAMINLEDIVSDVLESERLSVDSRCVEFISDIPLMMRLRADSEQLFRVLLNLVRNARQALSMSGQSGTVTVCAYEDEECWWIEVIDTGPGLPSKAQEYLFRPFRGSTHTGGFGLGLAIAEELVRGHGGTLSLKKTGPEGTTFAIGLPKGDATIELGQ
ncbi:MAG: HAMP domain-containing sensor histidine kinase [Aestuariivita sp.]|nr:HAMP domain-containing sensor histidine kinase [Aestuariivita sp.]